jgi:hypothetical protein
MGWIIVRQLLGKSLKIPVLCATFLKKTRKYLPVGPPVCPDGTERALLLYLGCYLTASAVYTFDYFVLGSYLDDCAEINDVQANIVGVNDVSRLEV